MRIAVGMIGGAQVLMGILICVKPSVVNRLKDWVLNGPASRTWPLGELGLGVLIIWAAPASRAPLFIQVLGGLTILPSSGAPKTPGQLGR